MSLFREAAEKRKREQSIIYEKMAEIEENRNNKNAKTTERFVSQS